MHLLRRQRDRVCELLRCRGQVRQRCERDERRKLMFVA
jgi:hypothetical protein